MTALDLGILTRWPIGVETSSQAGQRPHAASWLQQALSRDVLGATLWQHGGHHAYLRMVCTRPSMGWHASAGPSGSLACLASSAHQVTGGHVVGVVGDASTCDQVLGIVLKLLGEQVLCDVVV